MADATEIAKMWNRPAIVCSAGGIPINDFHLREKDAEIATLRARIKDLEAAQGARVPLDVDTFVMTGPCGGNHCVWINPSAAHPYIWGFAHEYQAEQLAKAIRADLLRSNLLVAAAPPAPSAPSREPMTEAAVVEMFTRPWFGVIHKDGTITKVTSQDYWNHEFADEAQYYGGDHDARVARAVIAALHSALGQEKG